jgi:hypothetical protein
MTFTEAALEILRREGKPLHFKDLTERAMTKKLLTFVGRTPEVTMQTQLTAAVKKAPGNPFVRVKPGVFGLLRYPEVSPEEKERDEAPARAEAKRREAAPESRESKGRPNGGGTNGDANRDSGREGDKAVRPQARTDKAAGPGGDDERGRRRRRRGGRGRGGAKENDSAGARNGEGESETATSGIGRETSDQQPEDSDEPMTVGLSAEARAAALAETGVLEGDDDMTSADDDADEGALAGSNENEANAASDDDGDAPLSANGAESGDRDTSEDGAFGTPEASVGAKTGDVEDPARRRRRRRRRRRGGEGDADLAGGDGPESSGLDDAGGEGAAGGATGVSATSETAAEPQPPGGGESSESSEAGAGVTQAARRIMAPLDAAIEILRGQPPGRGVHVRQIADSAIRRRLIHGEPNEAWRVIRTSLAAEPKDRLRSGMRPRVRAAGAGLYALARRPPDPELEKAEQIFGEARRALRERTIAALEKRITDLPPGAFEALARVLLQREGLGPTTFVKRVEGTIYVEALRGRGSRPSKCLIALRPGGSAAGRRSIGELRAGIRARGQDEGLLMLAGRLAEDAIAEWKQPGSPLEIADGAGMAETCARHGVGVLSAVLNVDFVDADFFAELAEG